MEKNTKDTAKHGEAEVQKDSLGQPNPAWELERKNIEEAAQRSKDAEKAEKSKAA